MPNYYVGQTVIFNPDLVKNEDDFLHGAPPTRAHRDFFSSPRRGVIKDIRGDSFCVDWGGEYTRWWIKEKVIYPALGEYTSKAAKFIARIEKRHIKCGK